MRFFRYILPLLRRFFLFSLLIEALSAAFLLPTPYSLPLSRRPSERAAAEQVDVEMIHGMTTVLAGVDYHAVARGETLGAGDLRCGPQQVAEQRAIILI